jgi:hypothetical protein
MTSQFISASAGVAQTPAFFQNVGTTRRARASSLGYSTDVMATSTGSPPTAFIDAR